MFSHPSNVERTDGPLVDGDQGKGPPVDDAAEGALAVDVLARGVGEAAHIRSCMLPHSRSASALSLVSGTAAELAVLKNSKAKATGATILIILCAVSLFAYLKKCQQ